MTAIYRMELEGWSADKAYEEMKDYHFGASFHHPEFKRFVYDYEPAPAETVLAGGIAATN